MPWPVAGDRVDGEQGGSSPAVPVANRRSRRERQAPARRGRPRRAGPGTAVRIACARTSAANADRADVASRTAPSGWAQAPRPVSTQPAVQPLVQGAAGRPDASWAKSAAIAGSPNMHGPHWSALWSASQPSTRAVSATPQASGGSANSTPAPGAAPICRSGPDGQRPGGDLADLVPASEVAADQHRAACRARRRGPGPGRSGCRLRPRTPRGPGPRRRWWRAWCRSLRRAPARRNQAGPNRAIRAMCANVSTLLISVGPLVDPFLVGPGRRRGRLGFTAVQPVRRRRSPNWTRSRAAVRGPRWRPGRCPLWVRSPTACRMSAIRRSGLGAGRGATVLAPTAAAARTAPSSTRCGARVSRALSLSLAGSLSMPLATTTGSPRCSATARSLRPVGKPAPASAGQARLGRPRRSARSAPAVGSAGIGP